MAKPPPHTQSDVRAVEACLLEAGLVKGRDFVSVELSPITSTVFVRRWIFHRHPDYPMLVWRALTLCGLCDKPFDEWKAPDGMDEQAGARVVSDENRARRARPR